MKPEIANAMHEMANAVYAPPGRGRHWLIVRRFERLQYAFADLLQKKRPRRPLPMIQIKLFENGRDDAGI